MQLFKEKNLQLQTVDNMILERNPTSQWVYKELLRLMPKDTFSVPTINLTKILELLNDTNLQFQTVFNMFLNTIEIVNKIKKEHLRLND